MPLKRGQISIFIVWLFHISAIIGIYLGHDDFFLSKSWMTLLISAFLLLLNSNLDKRTYLLLLAFTLGFLAEVVGVQTGLLFGNYTYGENLGVKAFDVPLIIGVNWVVLSLLSKALATQFVESLWWRIVLSSLIMVAIDLAIEPVAPKFDYWTFEAGLPTWKNYLGWFLVALPLQLIIEKSHVRMNNRFALNLLAAQLVFFMSAWNA